MIPPILQRRADFIFRQMGGVEEAREFIPDKDIVDTALFYGTIAIVEPYGKAVYGLGGSFNYDYSKDYDIGDEIAFVSNQLYDLGQFGYLPDSHYYILDKDFVFIYKDRAPKLRFQGNLSHYYGFTDKDIEFLTSYPHGYNFHLLFYTPQSPKLIRGVINAYPNPSAYEAYLIEEQKKITQRRTRKENELIIYTTTLNTYLTLHTLKDSIIQDYSESQIANHPNAVTVNYSPGSTLYIKTNDSLWVTLREYLPCDATAEKEFLYTKLPEVLDNIYAQGWRTEIEETVGLSVNTYLLFYRRNEEGYDEELTLNIDREGYIEEITQTCFRVVTISPGVTSNFPGAAEPLPLNTLYGENLESLLFTAKGTVFVGSDNFSRANTVRSSFPLGKALTVNSPQRNRFRIYSEAVYRQSESR